IIYSRTNTSSDPVAGNCPGGAVMSMVATTMTANVVSNTKIDLSWPAVTGAIYYRLQRATDAAFTTNLVDTSVGGLSNSANGLSEGTTYYFRIAAKGTVGTTTTQGDWSATVNATSTAMSLVAPTLTATAAGSFQVNLAWSAIPGAVNYHLQRATDAGFTANLVDSTINGESSSAIGLMAGTTYYFRVAALSATKVGNWTTTATASTDIPHVASITFAASELRVLWSGGYRGSSKSWTAPTGSKISAFYVDQSVGDGWEDFLVYTGGVLRYDGTGVGGATVPLVTPATTIQVTLWTDCCMTGYGGQVWKVDLIWP
ncbi:MAG: fibronectin type III domain-containing protein, partial [Candidatus Saccharibacteria bacterium]